MTDSLVVIGIGSPQGDDAIAWIVVDELIDTIPADKAVRFIKCERTPFDFWGQIPARSQVVLLDAIADAEAVGKVHAFQLIDGRCNNSDKVSAAHSTHIIDTFSALVLAQRMNALPPYLDILGIAIDSKCSGETISAALRHKKAFITRTIYDFLNHKIKLPDQQKVTI